MSWSARKSSQLQRSAFPGLFDETTSKSQWFTRKKTQQNHPCSCYMNTVDHLWLYSRLWVRFTSAPCMFSITRLGWRKNSGDMIILVSREENWVLLSQATQHNLTFLIIVAHFKTTQIPLVKESQYLTFLEWGKHPPMVEEQENKYLNSNSAYRNYVL